MPQHMRILDDSDPLHVFAADLRCLRDGAVRRPIDRNSPEADKNRVNEPLSIDEVCYRHQISRASIYAALAGTRLPSRRTLLAMVRAWAPSGEAEISEWMARRLGAEAESKRRADKSSPPGSSDPQSVDNSDRQSQYLGSTTSQWHLPTSDGQRTQKSDRSLDGSATAVDPDDVPELAQLRLATMLQQLRKRGMLPPKAVAMNSKSSYSTISAVLRGSSLPSSDLLERILQVVRASKEDAAEARRLLVLAKSIEQVYYLYSELRNEEMIEAYVNGDRNPRRWNEYRLDLETRLSRNWP